MIPPSLVKVLGELDKAAFEHGRAAGRLDSILDAMAPPVETPPSATPDKQEEPQPSPPKKTKP